MPQTTVVALRQAPVKLAAAVTPLGFAASARSADENAPKKLSTTGAHTKLPQSE